MKKIAFIFIAFISLQTIAQDLVPIVSVTGEGAVTIVPDEVEVRLSVEHSGKDIKTVKSDNDQAVDAVLKFLKQFGIADKDMQTQHVRLNKSYDYNTKNYKFVASQTLTVLLKKTADYDKMMTGLLEQGINRIDNVSFRSSEMERLKAEARVKAIANAKQKATEYAGELNQKIGKAIVISETSSQNHPTPPMYRMASDSAMETGVETLAVGELSVTAKVYVSFQLL